MVRLWTVGYFFHVLFMFALTPLLIRTTRSKRRENKRSREELFDRLEITRFLDKKRKHQLRERVKLELDFSSERGSKSVARPMAPDSFTRFLDKMAATVAISAAAKAMAKKLRI